MNFFGMRPTPGFGLPKPGDDGSLPQTQPAFGAPPAPPPAPVFGAPSPVKQMPGMTMTPQTQPVGPPRDALPSQPSRFHRMAQGILGQRFNRQIPVADRSGLTGIGGILDNAVDGWATKKGYQV